MKSPLLPIDPKLEKRIGKHAFAWLKRSKAKIDTSKRVDEGTLRAKLAQHEYPAHPAVLAFEERYGGIFTHDDWLFGPWACLTSGGHVSPRGDRKREKLVPVAYSPNDIIYFLDAKGRGWAQDTIEDPKAMPFARDLDRLVAKIGTFFVVFEHWGTKKRIDVEGAHGARFARTLKLPRLAQPSDEYGVFWGDDRSMVIELHEGRTIKTTATSNDAKAIAQLSARDSA